MKVKLINEQITSDYGANLLRARGIEDLDAFLNPTPSNLESFSNLKNIEEGARLIYNLKSNDKVAIVVDCDVDGYTSAAIIGQYIERLLDSITIDYYIHEAKAHGLEEHWETIAERGYNLVIVPDAGSNDSKYAEKIEAPILVIDHHIVEDENFAVNMVVINNQISPYKNKNLSGAGMVYQFCRCLDNLFNVSWSEDYIDLAALGICGDMMSALEPENQYIWRTGFSNIKNYFFLTLIRKQAYSITGKEGTTDEEIISALTPTSVAFYIVPLINAMIRVGTVDEKNRLFTAFLSGHNLVPSHKRGAKGELEEVAVESARECTNAKNHQNKFKENAVNKLEYKIFKNDWLENKILFIVLDEDDDFPSTLNGSTISAR